MTALDLIKLPGLMELTAGSADIAAGIIDGPVILDHADLSRDNIREVHGALPAACARDSSAACLHGTFIAGMLSARRGTGAPAICPGCTLLIRPVFAETTGQNIASPNATPEVLAAAIVECIAAGARVLNLSLTIMHAPARGQHALQQALDYAAQRGVLIVAAAGNQGMIGSSAVTAHPWVIPVAACDRRGKPLDQSNLGHSIGRHGLRAPGEQISSLGMPGQLLTLSGTSVAAPFVTGTIVLLWSQFPAMSGSQLRWLFMRAHARGRPTVTPPLLDAWAAYQILLAAHSRR
jgi:subtilisin family serine protease